MRRRHFLNSFADRLIVFTVSVIALSIILSFLLTSILYSVNITSKNEQQTLQSFSEADKRISVLLSDVYNSAYEFCRTDALVDYMFSGQGSEIDLTFRRFNMANALSDVVKSTADIRTALYFNESGRMGGISLQRRFFSEDTDYPFYSTLRSLSFGHPQEIIWLDSVPMSSFKTPDKVFYSSFPYPGIHGRWVVQDSMPGLFPGECRFDSCTCNQRQRSL